MSLYCRAKRLHFIWLVSPMPVAPLTLRLTDECANDAYSGPEAA